MDTIIQSLYQYFKQCPVLHDGKINVDYLPEHPTEYTIDAIPSNPIVKSYVDGSSVRQYLFAFGSREFYGPDVNEQLTNSGFYEDLSAWMEQQSRCGSLPELPEGMTAQKITAQSTGYLFQGDARHARYQIQCRLQYFKEAN